ncbi:hypothetical protein COCCADRAFT_10039 [Bipolaris zeicola 26-R-13]|uniref:Hypervirulence associated protein TUDOR domain-containing protein n=1 Tax=Cochliobolus carbonum (strain 26-R-13) TaxID=930089 RepID=W6XPB5_COCC2|nr:uncharacterized protein COCCADRAFT_10039 [Bipolaris zeicola 26-R-13]EUC27353.1 hypothetical protein COCCADRAFT_10039 [Bipolaris zeicola 26-R-13]
MPSKTDDKYSDLEVREPLKGEEVQGGGKGCAPSQRSATKGQMMASEHKKRGSDHRVDEKHETATDEECSSTKGYVKINKKSVSDCTTHWDDPEYMESNEREYRKFQQEERRPKGGSHEHEEEGGKKRGRGANAVCPNKKAKNTGGGDGEPTGAAGDKTRVPKRGQEVQWHGRGGIDKGQVVEVLYEEKEVEGKRVAASREDPRVVIKSELSGETRVLEAEAVYFE